MELKRLSKEEIEQKMKDIQDWILQSLEHPGSPDMLFKMFPFEFFKDAKEFVDKVSDIAEGLEHYPTINFTTKYASIILWTPSLEGLTKKDFGLAKSIDELSQPDMEKDKFIRSESEEN